MFCFLLEQFETNQIFYGEGSKKQTGKEISIANVMENPEKGIVQIEQKFQAEYDHLCKIYIYLENSNYESIVQNQSKITFGIKDELGNVIKEENLQYTGYLAEKEKYCFSFPEQEDSKEKNYSIYIILENSTIGLKLSQIEAIKTTNGIENLKINGNTIENTMLTMTDCYRDTEAQIMTYLVFGFLAIFSFMVSLMIYERPNLKPEQVFLYVVPMFCLLFTIAMPISKGHDETIHWYKVYEQAEGRILGEQGKVVLPKGVIGAFVLENPKTKITNYSAIFENEDHTINNQYIEMESRTATYSPITYLPQIIGIKIGSLFTNNAIILAYIARISNIASCMFLLYMAIKKIPYGKNVIFLLSMIPIAIEGFSTISADGMAIASSVLLIAYVLKLREEKETSITNKQLIILGILSAIVAISKTVYLPIVGIIFLLPKEKFQSRKKQILLFTIFAIIACVVDVAWYLATGLSTTSISFIGTIKRGILFADPIGTLGQVLYTIIMRFPTYFNEIFGGKLGWNEYVEIYVVPYVIGFGMFFISTTGKEKKAKFKIIEKIWIAIIILAIVGIVFMAMFLEWSMPGATYIMGVQGRYLIPTLLPICLLLNGRFKDDAKTTRWIGIMGTIIQIYVMISIFVYHI